MQLLETAEYGPHTSGTEKEYGGNSENIGEASLKTHKITQNALTGPAHCPGEKEKGGGKKNTGRFFAEKNCFSEVVLCF
jgi:hypothetical protein